MSHGYHRSWNVTRMGALWPWLLAIVAVFTWRSTIATYFAQDDFRWLLLASGDDPAPAWTPRFLSMHLFFRAMLRGVGPTAWAFHAVGLALFLLAGLCFYFFLARRVSPGFAVLPAALWLTSPALFVALHWSSAASDLLCALFLSVAVLLLAEDRTRIRRFHVLAPLLFACALASKEVAVGAAPALVLLDWDRNGAEGRTRGLVYVALAALSAALAMSPASVAWGQAYTMSTPAALQNLPAYVAVGVFAGAALQSVSDFGWSRFAGVQLAGWLLLATWLVLLIRTRSKGAWLGALWFFGLLAPVLTLQRQFYFYYLLCALPGLLVSAVLLAAQVRHPAWRRALVIGGALLVIVQIGVVHLRSRALLPNAPLPRDFVLRRAHIARHAIEDLERQRAQVGSQVVLIGQQPLGTSVDGEFTAAPTAYDVDPYWDDNVWAALAEGDALRWGLPQIREVRFRRWLAPGFRGWTIAAFEWDGRLRIQDHATYSGVPPDDTSSSLKARLSRADRFMLRKMFPDALQELEEASRVAPENADLLLNVGTLHAMMGDTASAVREIATVVERFPRHAGARYNLGLLYWRTGRPGDARRIWEPLLTEQPGSDLARAARALSLGEIR